YLTLLWQATERPMVVVVDGNKQLEVLSELLETFFELLTPDARPLAIPALDVIPNQRLSPHNEITEKRAIGLWRLATRRVPLTITPVAGALVRTEGPEFYRQLALPLRVGDELPLEEITRHLDSIGYQRREPV
ncbi:MAG TPA: transcription-repair coupling factor, partial [Solibacterales bacterium]|nr:transcription-repair coupling factor [Bryobacterales bacterium]